MAIERNDVIDYIKNLTVLELSELVKELEEVLGVSAAAPMAVAMPGAGGAEVAAEQTEFDVELTAPGDKKIQAIKVVRAVMGLGLKEAKTFVEEAPKNIKEGISREDAEAIEEQFEAVGATITIK